MNNFVANGILGDYNLIVVGGGAAGGAAAITAGRLGLNVLLVEQLSFLGGTGVASQVTPWMSNQIELGPLNEGLNAELQQDLEATGQATGYAINPEALKGLLERKAVDAGVQLLYEATVVDTDFSEEDRKTLVIATRQGLFRASARCVIDATGDAHVAHRAGARCREGREGDLAHQPMSLRFVLGGCDIGRVRDFLLAEGGPDAVGSYGSLFTNGPGATFFLRHAEQLGWPEKWLQSFSIQFFEIPGRPGELWFNCPRIIGFDPLDPVSLSAAYVEGRRMIDAYLELFRKRVGGAAEAYLVMVAPLMGIREGRRIEGHYTLTRDDFLERRKFEDGICLNRYPIDIHNPHGQGVEWVEMAEGDWHEIPFRCLIPNALRSLLVAGRCISSDFDAQASYRIIPNCRTMGEASAVAARIAADSGIDVSEVDGREVRALMIAKRMLPERLLG